MIKLVLLPALFLAVGNTFARQVKDTLTADYVRSFSYSFKIQNGELSGEGASGVHDNSNHRVSTGDEERGAEGAQGGELPYL